VMDDLEAARSRLRAQLAEVESVFTGNSYHPASIPMYEMRGYTRRDNRRYRVPVAYLHFDGSRLSLTEEPRPFKAGPTHCSRCKGVCSTCLERQRKARKAHDRRQALRAQPVMLLDIEEMDTISSIISVLPEMEDRLLEDASVDPEELLAATHEARRFVDLLVKLAKR
jgi:hypothetical protein